MDRRKFNRGIPGKAGRKSKKDEQRIIELLTPMEEDWRIAMNEMIKKRHPKAMEMYAHYMYGKPTERIDHTSNGESIDIPISTWKKDT